MLSFHLLFFREKSVSKANLECQACGEKLWAFFSFCLWRILLFWSFFLESLSECSMGEGSRCRVKGVQENLMPSNDVIRTAKLSVTTQSTVRKIPQKYHFCSYADLYSNFRDHQDLRVSVDLLAESVMLWVQTSVLNFYSRSLSSSPCGLKIERLALSPENLGVRGQTRWE